MVVVLGDSISAGIGASHYLARFPARIPASLVIAKPGWSSRNLLKAVEKLSPELWQDVTDLIVLIGGNDLLFAYTYLISEKKGEKTLQKILDAYRKSVQGICDIVKARMKPQSKIYLVGLYNPFPNVERAVDVIGRLNDCTKQLAKQNNAVFVNLHDHFLHHEVDWIADYKNGTLEDLRLIHNPIHPSDEGHSEISRILREAIENARKPRRTQQASRPRSAVPAKKIAGARRRNTRG